MVGREIKSTGEPPAIRRALQHRDCGETSLNNIVLLFRRRHLRLVHKGSFGFGFGFGFGIHKTLTGDNHFNNPAGQIIPTSGDTRSRGNFLNLFTDHEQSGIHITPKTQIPNWLGERMDDQLAVEGLLFRE